MKTQERRLMWHGMLLFLLGLITGLLEQRFTNLRMGLSAHLKGVMNGIFLLALGAAWNEVRLPHPVKVTAYCTALYGTYVNWLVISIAAAFNTAAHSPITSAGHSGQPWEESVVAMGFLSVAFAMIAAVDPRSLGSSRNSRGQRYLETFGFQHSREAEGRRS
jgi:hydroxylaminobenzene mutase